MAVAYTIRDEVLTMELAGTYETQDVVHTFLAALDDPKCPSPVALLVDVSQSESLATRPGAEIRAVAEFLEPFSERIGGRCAVVAPRDVHFGLSQMGSAHAERVGIASRVFRSRNAALEWLRSAATTS